MLMVTVCVPALVAHGGQPDCDLAWPRDSAFFDIALDVAGDFGAVSEPSRFLTEVQNHGPEFSDLEGQESRIVSPDGAGFLNLWADGQGSTNLLNPFAACRAGRARCHAGKSRGPGARTHRHAG